MNVLITGRGSVHEGTKNDDFNYDLQTIADCLFVCRFSVVMVQTIPEPLPSSKWRRGLPLRSPLLWVSLNCCNASFMFNDKFLITCNLLQIMILSEAGGCVVCLFNLPSF